MKTKERLAKVLSENGLLSMAEQALRGRYDDYESGFPTPCMDLVNDLYQVNRLDLVQRAKNGEWDGTKEESEAWFKREGKYLLEGK